MAKGPSAAIARDPRLKEIPAGVPLVSRSGLGAAASYTGRVPSPRPANAMMRYSGHTNPLARRR